jgi:cyanate permease
MEIRTQALQYWNTSFATPVGRYSLVEKARTIIRIGSLLLAVGILLIGHGLQLTLLPVFAMAGGWSSTLIGATGSFYFLGFVAECLLIPKIVSRVGHIRSFMVMAAVATIVVLGAVLVFNFWAWLFLRFATGKALSGL